MALAGWNWNLMNLMALPLMLGTGVDYTIFIQLALRRHGGDLAAVRRSVGRALDVVRRHGGGRDLARWRFPAISAWPAWARCARWASAPTCSFRFFSCRRGGTVSGVTRGPATRDQNPADDRRVALKTTRLLSRRLVAAAAGRPDFAGGSWSKASPCCWPMFIGSRSAGGAKWWCENFLPVFGGDRAAAEKAARAAHRKFAAKLVDLWRIESGEQVHELADQPERIGNHPRRATARTRHAVHHPAPRQLGTRRAVAEPARHPADHSHAGRTRRRPDRICARRRGRATAWTR